MKFGIKRKLLFAFIIVLLIPTLLTLVLLIINGYNHITNPLTKEFNEIEKFQQNIVQDIKNDPSIINYDIALNEYVNPFIKDHDINVQVIDSSNNVIYDSSSFDYNSEKKVYSYSKSNSIIVNDKVIAYVKFYSNTDFSSNLLKFNYNNMLIFLAGFITLIGFILMSVIYISKSVLVPLEELNLATENIVNGNLHYKIKYNSKDEIGRFCESFDKMRIKLKELLEKQAKDEQSRKEMIASISHDLRTPISSIKGYVEGLQDGIAEKQEDVDEYLSIIKNKTEKLDLLIDDLFQFSRLELNKLDMIMKKENSKQVLNEILYNVESELQIKNIELLIKRPLPSVSINIDRHRINQVIDNLIQNAQNYANENSKIEIGTNIVGNFLQIYIKDNGIGITQNDLPNIFKRFYRGEKSRSREYGGAGLGLAICKHIIEAHGGKIWVESEVNNGSVFYIEIPILISY